LAGIVVGEKTCARPIDDVRLAPETVEEVRDGRSTVRVTTVRLLVPQHQLVTLIE
jgi:hypothetical protein